MAEKMIESAKKLLENPPAPDPAPATAAVEEPKVEEAAEPKEETVEN